MMGRKREKDQAFEAEHRELPDTEAESPAVHKGWKEEEGLSGTENVNGGTNIAGAGTRRIRELEEKNRHLEEILRKMDAYIHTTFGSYLTEEVLEDLLQKKDGSGIGGERREVTMLFSDIRRSTDLSETMEADDFIRMLNHYLVEMIEIINAWQGNILDFEGDAIVVVFGAPRPNDFSARDAVACAVAMQRRMKAVNEWNRAQGYPDISMGIGIHTGDAILGNIGSMTRRKYDMIGRNVNLASRVQGFTRGGQILVTTETLTEAGEKVQENKAGSIVVRPKGIRSDILLHDIIGFGEKYLSEVSGRGPD